MKSFVSRARCTPGHCAARVSVLQTAVAGAFIALPMLFAAAPAGAVQFIVTDLGTLGGTYSQATGINAAGQVVGFAYTSGNASHRAFLWQGGGMLDLGTLGGTNSVATGINGAGQVVGQANTTGSTALHAYLWQAGAMRDLGTLGGTNSYANGINAAGQVVGAATTSGEAAQHAFLWQGGGLQDLGTLGGTIRSANGINAAGQVVGYAYTNGNAAYRPFLWQAGSMNDLGTLGGTAGLAYGINAAGQVVGSAQTSGDAAFRPFLWQASGGMQDLGTLGGTGGGAYGINAAGQEVGAAHDSGNVFRPFLRGAQGGMVNLNALLVAGSTAIVTRAAAVNDFGQIAGTATIAGEGRAVLLTPTGTLAWMGSGSGGSFSDGANWELGFAPNQFLDAVVAPAGRQTLYASVDATVRNLSLGGAAGSSGRPLLVLIYGANLSATNVVIQPTGMLTGDGTISGNLTSLGTVQADNLSVSGSFVNAGLINGSGYLNATLSNVASGTVRTAAGEYLRVVGGAHTNTGRIEVTSGGTQEFIGSFTNAGTLDISGGATQQYTDGLLTNANGGRILLNSAVLRAGNWLSNAGQVQVSYGGATVHGRVITRSGGKIILSGNSNTTFYDALDVESGGELRVSSGSTAVFFGQVSQRTGSVFSGTGSKFYEGGLSIGGSPGLGYDAGNVSFGSGNVYLEEIGGLAAGTEFDKYVVAGTLSFGGTLNVVWWGGFSGAEGQSFDLFDWGSSTGTFSTLDFSAAPLAAGLTWDTSRLYLTGEIAITAVPEPESWALLLAGLAIVGRAARRARRERD